MSEYIEIETEIGDDGTEMHVYTNLKLSDQNEEQYTSTAEMEEGSPVAQSLSVIDGIARLTIEGCNMIITRSPDTEWHSIVSDVSAALKDFFL
jgi:reverse gyrase